MAEFSKLEPCGNYVLLEVLKLKPVNKNKSSLIITTTEEQSALGQVFTDATTGEKLRVIYKVKSLGPKVESPEFKIGDYVKVNAYDVQGFSDDVNHYALCKAESVLAVLDVVETE